MPPSSWERSLLDLFDDLEQQAEGLHLDERQQEATALGDAEFSGVSVESRLLASVGSEVTLRLPGDLLLRGSLVRAGAGWMLIEDGQRRAWLVPTAAVLTVGGLGARAAHDKARTVLAALGLGSVLRRLAQGQHPCVLHLREGLRVEGRLGRSGRDFVEVHAVTGVLVVPVAALVAVTEAGTG